MKLRRLALLAPALLCALAPIVVATWQQQGASFSLGDLARLVIPECVIVVPALLAAFVACGGAGVAAGARFALGDELGARRAAPALAAFSRAVLASGVLVGGLAALAQLAAHDGALFGLLAAPAWGRLVLWTVLAPLLGVVLGPLASGALARAAAERAGSRPAAIAGPELLVAALLPLVSLFAISVPAL